ncbi:MAG: PAS domain S-box protein [Ignavibacteriae bacterium]|nr:PAS domain S-box protein [Ignavibacteriota bacterium]
MKEKPADSERSVTHTDETNIELQKRTEELRFSEQRFRSLVEHSWDAVALFDANGAILYASPSTKTILGYDPDEFVGRNAFDLIHPDDHVPVTARLQEALTHPRQSVYVFARVRHKNGAWRWLEGMFTNLLDDPAVGAIVNNYRDFTDHKIAEEALRDSEERYRIVADTASDGIITIDSSSRILFVNPAIERIFGYRSDEMVGRDVTMLMPKYFRHLHRSSLSNYLATGKRHIRWEAIELPGLHKSGREVPLEISFGEFLKDGEHMFTGIIRDISERKHAEARFRLVVEASPYAIIMTDFKGRIVLVNSQAENLFGYTREELLNASIDQLVPEHQRKAHAAQRALFSAGPASRPMGAGRDLKGRRKDGVEIPLEIGLSPLMTSEGSFVLASIVDITERKRAEEALRKSEERHRTTLDNMMQGCQIVDFNWRFRFVNDAAARQRKQTPEALLGHTMMEVYPGIEETTLFAELKHCMLERAVRRIEDEFMFPDGSTAWFELNVQPAPEGIFILSIDISERKWAEAKLKISLREKEVLLKEIHHRVKNNLQVIASLLDLQASYTRDEKVIEMFRETRDRAYVMSGVHELLYQTKDLTRIDLGEYLNTLVNDLVASYGTDRSLISLELKMDSLFVNMDTANCAGLIVHELISNALKHAFPDGREGGVTVELRQQVQTEEHRIKLTVSDDGVGFAPGLDFRATESLGLQLVNTLVEQLQGNIALDATAGTRFIITFNELQYKERVSEVQRAG